MGPGGLSFLVAGMIPAGQPGRVSLQAVGADDLAGPTPAAGSQAQPQAAAASDNPPGDGEDPQPEPLGFPARPGRRGQATTACMAADRVSNRAAPTLGQLDDIELSPCHSPTTLGSRRGPERSSGPGCPIRTRNRPQPASVFLRADAATDFASLRPWRR
jgi:hypothetical protein